jgi:hypothetical protein
MKRGDGMKLDALDHPKTYDLAARLGVSLPTAIGHLELLWAFTGKKAAQGNIGKWPDGSISGACLWAGDPAVFVAALVDSGFLERSAQHRLIVHDWHDHAPRWVKSKLASARLWFVTEPSQQADVSEDVVPDNDADAPIDIGADTKGREEKGREEKGRVGGKPPDNVDPDAWQDFVAHRKEIRKPLTARAATMAAQVLQALTVTQQRECVSYSVIGRYPGLFVDRFTKKSNGEGNQQKQRTIFRSTTLMSPEELQREAEKHGIDPKMASEHLRHAIDMARTKA